MRPRVASAAILACFPAGCAGIPRSPTPLAQLDALDCPRLADERAAALRRREAAPRARRGAWKAVLPAVVGIRHAAARSALGEADERLATVERRHRELGCAPPLVAPAPGGGASVAGDPGAAEPAR